MVKLMKNIKLKGKQGLGKVAFVDDEDYEKVKQYNWWVHKNGYIMRHKGYQHISLHHDIIGKPAKGFETDHINGNKLDNQRANLRFATSTQNKHNRNKASNKTSVYKGVRKDRNYWRAYITNKKKQIELGIFSTEHQAAMAYDLWAIDLFGKFAKTNFNINI